VRRLYSWGQGAVCRIDLSPKSCRRARRLLAQPLGLKLSDALAVHSSEDFMPLDIETVRRVARLARLEESNERLPALAQELDSIMNWIEQLNEVDIEGVEPMTSAVDAVLPMRQDVVTDGGDPSKVLKNAPRSEDGFFVVPKVVE
jgi:aspartyl-tRNA(Asn)/glutamyl-tRNA(Gln) amidotransferase subunit C